VPNLDTALEYDVTTCLCADYRNLAGSVPVSAIKLACTRNAAVCWWTHQCCARNAITTMHQSAYRWYRAGV